KNNRRKLQTLVKDADLIMLAANGLLQRNNDTSLAFRQDSSFFYLTGSNEPNVILVIDKNEEFFILPPRDKIQDVFDGKINTSNLTYWSAVEKVFNYE